MTNPPLLTSWGQHPKHPSDHYAIVPEICETFIQDVQNKNWIPRGLGRSYGDSALADAIISSRRCHYLIDFDEKAGVLHCQSGVSLADIIKVFLPRGWFLPVTPGTKFVTVGGAIASDVHGKNHHHVGCFSEFVDELTLLLATGEMLVCSRNERAEIFHATCGGMGLTGFILSAKICLKKVSSSLVNQKTIRTQSLRHTINSLLENERASYSVAWLDCLAPAHQLGRSLVFLGEHVERRYPHLQPEALSLSLGEPKALPWQVFSPFLNAMGVKAFNALYYRQSVEEKNISLDKYFYPLDQLHEWNRLYGRAGFTQYQCVVPLDQVHAMEKILQQIRSYGAASFLSVLKIFGKQNENYLSFPSEGLTLALDFKISQALWPFLDRLDAEVISAGGRVYLAKDCRLNAENFRKMYSRVDEFLEVRERCDPERRILSLQAKRLEL